MRAFDGPSSSVIVLASSFAGLPIDNGVHEVPGGGSISRGSLDGGIEPGLRACEVRGAASSTCCRVERSANKHPTNEHARRGYVWWANGGPLTTTRRAAACRVAKRLIVSMAKLCPVGPKSALFWAAREGNIETIKELLAAKKAKVNWNHPVSRAAV